MEKIFNLGNLVYLSILMLPFYLLKVSFFGIPSNAFEVLAFFCLIWFLIQSRSFKIALSDYRTYFIPIGVIMVGLLFSTLFNGSYRIGFGIIKGWFAIPLLFAWVAVETLKAKEIFRALYASSFVVTVVSLLHFILGRITYDGRLEAIYNSPNYLAMYLAPAVVIGIWFWTDNKKYYNLSLVLIVFSLYLTFSYATWMAVFLAIAAGFVFEKREFFRNKKIALILVLILAAFLFQLGTSKMDSLLKMEERSSFSSRIMIWSSAAKIISDNPIWGIGPGNFQNKYLEYQKHFPPYLEWAVPQPHNIFLAFWLQAGFLGLAGFVSLLFLWFKELWRGSKREIQMISGSIMIYILLHGLVDTTYFKNDLAVVFWLIFFVAIKKPRSQEQGFLLEEA